MVVVPEVTKTQPGASMHVKRLLQKLLVPVMHKKRLDTLIRLVCTLLNTKKLSLTGLGRGMATEIQQRSGIRIVDRFLGNKKLYGECHAIQEHFCRQVIGSKKTPDIIVDWSISPNTNHHVLRAAMVAKGRAITIMEEVYPEKKLGTQKVQNRFLVKLKKAFPKDCKPCIITDGGFHNEWCKKVLELGWNYLVRIRVGSGKLYRINHENEWKSLDDISNKATLIPAYAGSVYLCKGHPLQTHLYTYKSLKKNRKSLNKSGKKKKDSTSKDYAKSAKEPWILSSSISPEELNAKKIIKKYKNRMQIEEGFRDLKSSKYGFGLEHALSQYKSRIKILLLIAMFASYYAWLIGYIAERNGLHYQFQSSSIKNRRILSFFFLGCEIIKRKIKMPIFMLRAAIAEEFCHDS
jgi:hypothetical protein